jgi:hypothetical protein
MAKTEIDYEQKLIQTLEKARDLSNLEHYNLKHYQLWIDQIKTKHISTDLMMWIDNQISYYQPKDREYAKFLEKLRNTDQ